jgi:hypothetical protein
VRWDTQVRGEDSAAGIDEHLEFGLLCQRENRHHFRSRHDTLFVDHGAYSAHVGRFIGSALDCGYRV